MSNEGRINELLSRLAEGYRRSMEDWKSDRENAFKDGRFLGYYEGKETILRCLEGETDREGLLNALSARFQRIKREWTLDKTNRFKDGKLLAYYEILQLVQTA
ncbi:MAG: hypothetical protein IJ074_07765 [Clostridia bacterium]|nr:hypothetical protein [Clostridia bacterium]